MPAVLALILSGMYLIAMIGLMLFEIPSGNKEAFVIMCGTLGTMLGVAIGFYYNTTQASKHKDQVIADMVASDKSKSQDQEQQ